jgi:unsaturated chondroitin disaccharide hydrolase
MKKFDSSIPEITDAEVSLALDAATARVRGNLPLYTHRCQNHSSVRGVYPQCDNDQWTTGFWPGEIWLAYGRTRDPAFRDAALTLVDSFSRRIDNRIAVDHHDMGFLYSPSCVSAWKLTGSQTARRAAILAARQLVSRFQEKGEFIQAWGAMGARGNYRYIIDCLLNLPLLYWAAGETGDRTFSDIADRHTATCLAHSIRPDGSTWHTFFMDPETGKGDHGVTCQGYRDDSSWARGQAWGIYGLALSYRHTKNKSAIGMFRRLAEYYVSRLPPDLVPYWDLVFTEESVAGKGEYLPSRSSEPRDSSSAAIVSCGLLEMAPFLPDAEGRQCRSLARRMMKSLFDTYATDKESEANGLLLHGTYSKKSPFNTCTEEGVDECLAWGDYYYMEALTRLSSDWDSWW